MYPVPGQQTIWDRPLIPLEWMCWTAWLGNIVSIDGTTHWLGTIPLTAFGFDNKAVRVVARLLLGLTLCATTSMLSAKRLQNRVDIMGWYAGRWEEQHGMPPSIISFGELTRKWTSLTHRRDLHTNWSALIGKDQIEWSHVREVDKLHEGPFTGVYPHMSIWWRQQQKGWRIKPWNASTPNIQHSPPHTILFSWPSNH